MKRRLLPSLLCMAIAGSIVRSAMLAKSDTITAVCYSLLALFFLGALACLNEKNS